MIPHVERTEDGCIESVEIETSQPYYIVKSSSIVELEFVISKYIESGYVPVGGVSVRASLPLIEKTPFVFYQSVYKSNTTAESVENN